MKKNNEEKKPILSFDVVGQIVVYGAAAFQAYHMGRAFHVYDPNGWHVGAVNIGGLILGGMLNVIVARAAINLPAISAAVVSLKELMPKVSKKADKDSGRARAKALKKMLFAVKQNLYSQVGFYALLFFSVVLIAPALFILWSVTLPFHPVFIGFMAVVGSVAPDIAITVGGVISSGAPARTGARSATDSPTKSVARAKKSDASATESATSASDSAGLGSKYPRRCEHCATDSPFGVLKSANAVGGHMKKHHPELCKPKALVEQFFNTEVEVKQ